MKAASALLLLLISSLACAQQNNPLETIDQARQRQSAENYDTYRNRGNDAPLGGYNGPLGDVEQRGVERPGYVAPAPVYQPQPTYQQPSSSGGDWRRGLR